MSPSRTSSNFQIPACAEGIAEWILTPEERLLTAAFLPEEVFSSPEVEKRLSYSSDEAGRLLHTAYRRSVIDMVSETEYRLGSFYGRLGVFCQFESKRWHQVPEATRKAIGDWYLEAFIQKNQPFRENRADQVAPLPEAIDFLKAHNAPVYVTACDCRSVFEHCAHTRKTCISFGKGPNTPYHRGHAEEISLEEAIELVRACDREGLIHTLEGSYGMCNCCSDCCFEYRSAKKCGTIGSWPLTHTIAVQDEQACVSCGLCVKRCPMGAFSRAGKQVQFAPSLCIGCGLCVSACPKGAIQLKERYA